MITVPFVGPRPTVATLDAQLTAWAAPASLRAGLDRARQAVRAPDFDRALNELALMRLAVQTHPTHVGRPLSTMGIDSLMAVELKNRIEADLQVRLPLIQVIQGPSVSELAELLLEQMGAGDVAAAPRPAQVSPAPRGKESLLLSLLALGKDKDERDG